MSDPTTPAARPPVRVVGEDRIRAAVDEAAALEAARRAFLALADGRASLPPPMSLELPGALGEVHVKGAALAKDDVFAVKVASGFYRNPDLGLPTGSGLMLVFDATTGFPVAVLLDNGYLTEIRTAAAGALAVQHLTPNRPLRVAVLGAGSQARYQIRAIRRVRSLRSVRVWAPPDGSAEEYARDTRSELGAALGIATTVEEAVRGADLVLTVTPSRRPLVPAPALQASATVIAVGADGPDKRELEVEVLARADKVVVDRVEQCLRLGELHHAVAAGVIGPDDVYSELGAIVAGHVPGREGDELIVCDLTGVGAQDAAVAAAAWQALGG